MVWQERVGLCGFDGHYSEWQAFWARRGRVRQQIYINRHSDGLKAKPNGAAMIQMGIFHAYDYAALIVPTHAV